MALGTPIHLRLSPAKQLAYEEEAARVNKPLATYLRERLETGDALIGEFTALRSEIRAGLVSGQHANVMITRQVNDALLLEMVLLLRELGGPERMKRTHAELNRQGVKAWTPS
ncbi:mobilization protein [Bordetella sp. 02P26C-1]|uniref:mobilization protein n=1 Tax=Bordetella sp. 02P26C-1 TaxID=2683195 RepID=UPI0013548BF2|nr:mobilization protein [Bordetella sp. 02P26C-1]MVW78083.1 mobilization protein [Bordetella sp. 02P26C-1]